MTITSILKVCSPMRLEIDAPEKGWHCVLETWSCEAVEETLNRMLRYLSGFRLLHPTVGVAFQYKLKVYEKSNTSKFEPVLRAPPEQRAWLKRTYP